MEAVTNKSLVFILLITISFAIDEQTLPQKNPNPITLTIDGYRAKYGKKYINEDEKQYRTSVFQKNFKKINQHNKNSKRNYDLGENQFLDLTNQQFISIYTTLIPSDVNTRQFVRDQTELRQLESENCFCNTTKAFKKIQLQNKISKNKQYTENKLNDHLAKIKRSKLINQNQFFIFSLLQNARRKNASNLTQITLDNSTSSTNTSFQNNLSGVFSNLLESTGTYSSNKTSTSTISSNVMGVSTLELNLKDIDWSNKTGPVRHQGKCGACYAFATINVLESGSSIYTLGGLFLQMSVQQIIDCARPNWNGCNGGLLQWGYSFMQTNGVTSNYRYPYNSGSTLTQGNCKILTGQFKILSYKDISNSCIDTRNQLQKKPVSTAVKAKNMQFYSQGIFDNCPSSDPLDHAIVLVGYNSTAGWKFKNSWGNTWGIGGFGWLSLNQTKNCGICIMPTVPLIKGQPI